MREESAQRVALVQAFEEADPEGRVLPLEQRRRATLRAQTPGGGEPLDTVAAARAGLLLGTLVARLPWLTSALARFRVSARALIAVVLVTSVAGFYLHALGSERRINLLSFPVLGVLAWNLVVYGALLVRATLRGAGGRAGAARSALDSMLTTSWLGARARLARHALDEDERRIIAKAVGSYAARWGRTAGPLYRARGRVLLHVAAAGLAVGMVAGMYVRGIAFEYRATWESTFLGPAAVATLLSVVLGPAAALLGRMLPTAELMTALRVPLSGEAAPWIHLYALTTVLVVVAPRLALAAREAWRVRRLGHRIAIDLGTAYFMKTFAGERGHGTRVSVVPYSYDLPPRTRDRLTALLLDLAGNHAEIRVAPVAAYGTEADDLIASSSRDAGAGAAATPGSPAPDGAGEERWIVLVFNLAQSPEQEVHGGALEATTRRIASAREPSRLLVVVDVAPLRRRLAGLGVESVRLAERQRAWERVVRAAALDAAFIDLDASDPPAALERMRAVLWPSGAVAVA